MASVEPYQAIVKILAGVDEPVSHRIVRALASQQLGVQVSSDEYFAQIEDLSSRGAIERSRGQGGKVRLLAETGPKLPTASLWTEPKLMSCLETYLNNQFWRDLDLPSTDPRSGWIVLNTSMTGSHEGDWTRPDFTAISITPFKVLPFPQIDVYTFELKAHSAGDAKAVHQSLHQTKMSNFGYFVWHAKIDDAKFEAIQDACRKHGIGLIRIEDPQIPQSWEIILEAERQQTSPLEIDRFLSTNRFSDDQRRNIRQKLLGV